MKPSTFLFTCLILFVFQTAIAQKAEPPGLMMIHQQTGKAKFIPENKRVTLTNYKGFKSSGRLEILSEEEVLVHGRIFRVDELAKVRRNLIGAKITGAVLFVLGSTIVDLELVKSHDMQDPITGENQFPNISPTGFIMMGAALPLLLYSPTYKQVKWTYQSIPSQETFVP